MVFLDTWQLALDFAAMHSITFISHQWIGWNHPDPHCVQYPAIIAAAETLACKLGVPEEDCFLWIGERAS